MAGFVKEVTPRKEALRTISERLCFPWPSASETLPLAEAAGLRCAKDTFNEVPYPPFSRSLRDGFAVDHRDACGATPGTPLFLTKCGDVAMGQRPAFSVSRSETAAIPTGGLLPNGADAVVMLEDTEAAGGWIEIRRAVQAGENIMREGEELAAGQKLLGRGEMIDFRTTALLATAGISHVDTMALKISVLSTGDEIVPPDRSPLPPGCIRDVNGPDVCALLKRYGFPASYRGIVSDERDEIEGRFHEELENSDVLVLSGGSSVGVRDHCSRLLSELPEPGLLVRGINMVPGKPTLAAGDTAAKKLVVSLPGHPLSCLVAAFTVLLPLLLEMAGVDGGSCGTRTRLPLSADLAARTGPEEFVPCAVKPDGSAAPLAAKSGYISVLAKADGLIRIPEERETIRAGEEAEVWLWQ